MHIKTRLSGTLFASAVLMTGLVAAAAEPNADRSSEFQRTNRVSTEAGALLLAGLNGTRSDPIVITEHDPADAVQAQMEALATMSRRQQVTWRVRAHVPVDGGGERVVRTLLDVVGVVDNEIVVQQESVYFRFSGLPAAYSLAALPPAQGFHDPRSGLRLPYQLNWLHLARAEDNEQNHPGYGWSVYYSAAGMKATVYVYDLGKRLTSDDIAQRRAQDEFASVLEQITMVHPGAKLRKTGPVGDRSGHGRWLLASAVLPDASRSAVALTVRDGYFVKVRITWQADDAVDTMATESLAEIMATVH